MKKFLSLICLMTFLTTTTSVWASVKVPANTNIPINVAKKETSKTVSSGTTIEAKIAEDVFIDDEVIFEKGDRAVLNVISVKKAGFVGIPGEIIISGGKVYDKNGVERRIDFNRQYTGNEKTWPKVCLACGIFIILAPLVLFGFVKGGQAEIFPVEIIDTKLMAEFVFN